MLDRVEHLTRLKEAITQRPQYSTSSRFWSMKKFIMLLIFYSNKGLEIMRMMKTGGRIMIFAMTMETKAMFPTIL